MTFNFDGQSFVGYAGDTLASALLANGIRLVGRSFKYHRPRGILSAGPEETNALVELRTGARREPNTRATQTELYDGLVAASQNAWPSLSFDVRAVNSWFGSLLGAGFYYKTFMWPASFWEKVYEPLIRRAAGLGRGAGVEDPDRYEKSTLHCDILVIGAGPAGLAAALAAARTGARVVLCEQDFELGGRLLAERCEIDGAPACEWLAKVVAELAAYPDVSILKRTTVFAVYDQGGFAALERVGDHVAEPAPFEPRQRLWRLVARASVLATGAIEQPLVFGDNDRPGVMLAASVRTYVNRFGVLPGRSAVVFSTSDDAVQTVEDMRAAGGSVAAIVDPRIETSRGIRSVEIVGPGGATVLECDLLAMSGGWNPAIHLASHLGNKPVWDQRIASFLAERLPPGMRVAGAAAGRKALRQCLEDGSGVGVAIADMLGFRAVHSFSRPATTEPEGKTEGEAAEVVPVSSPPLWRVPGPKGKAFVDFQNDVTAADLELAAREGFSRIEHMKRYTTLGMATDQGKTANVNGIAIMAEILGDRIDRLGTTTFRPPFTPVAISAFAGHSRRRHFRPTRLPPTHEFSRERGAVFIEAGSWLRAQYYPLAGEKDWLTTAIREARNVRAGVGFCDVSTLGKIDIQGRDAGAFLDRVYANTFSTLAPGKARYGLMLREDGIVLDDGTTTRLSEDRWYMTTTTTNAGRVLQQLEFCHQVLWPELDVRFASVTDQWAQVSLAGPRSREVLQRIVAAGIDVSDAALPYMGFCEGRLRGGEVHARIFRISYSGERAFEIAVPARWGHSLMQAIAQAGSPDGIVPYGTEALAILRVEKGHVAAGELNGQTSAADLGLGKMMSTRKDYVGRVLAGRPALIDPGRPTLVGLKAADPQLRLDGGAHLFEPNAPSTLAHDLGFVTSVAFSPEIGAWIGLGLLANGRDRLGQMVRAYDPLRGKDTLLVVCDPCFVDPTGERLRG
jgi:sarcosine oxidase subunit alpha